MPPATSTLEHSEKGLGGQPWWLSGLLAVLNIGGGCWNQFLDRSRNGPDSPFVVELKLESADQKILLQWATARTIPSHLAQRAKMILMTSVGMGLAPTGDLLSRGRDTVRRWIKRFITDGIEGLRDRRWESQGPYLPRLIEIAIISYRVEAKAIGRLERDEGGLLERDTPLEDNEGNQVELRPGPPQSRLSTADIHELLIRDFGEEAPSLSTLRRWMRRNKFRPWRNNSWIHIRDGKFWEKGGVVLDLYNGIYQGEKLGEDDIVFSADEMTQIQILERITTEARPGFDRKVDHEYIRHGVLKMHAGRNITTGQVYHHFVDSSNMDNFRQFVREVMEQEPFKSANRVFWIVDNGSCHKPSTFGKWLSEEWPEKAIAVHTPAYASWLNQIECFFSILVAKALTPRDFDSAEKMMTAIDDYIAYYNETAKPFKWTYTKEKLAKLLDRLKELGLYPPPKRPLQIEGIGPKKRKQLLDAFGSIEGIKDAAVEEIMSLKRFGPKLAQRVVDHLGMFPSGPQHKL